MNKYIVIINGMGGVGKSTFIRKCREYCEQAGLSAYISELSTVDYVKEVARFCGWNGEKEEKDRQFLSDLKKTLAKWKNIPLDFLYQGIEAEFLEDENSGFEYGIIFVNSREIPDILAIEEKYKNEDVKTSRVYIEKDDIIHNEAKDIVADIEEFSHNCNYKITNNGTLFQLFMAASVLIDDLLEIHNEKTV